MSEEIILEKFVHLKTYLIGNPKQFFIAQNKVWCLRRSCEDCPHLNQGCQNKPGKLFNGLIPSSRRGVGFEEKSFLVLRLKPGYLFEPPLDGVDNTNKVPMNLWNHSKDHLSLCENNLHYLLSDLTKSFRVLKGQFRFYGTLEEFQQSEYSKYFNIELTYTPEDYIVAFDFSAIEPRFSAISTKDPAWVQIYDGTPKVIIKEVQASFDKEPSYLIKIKNKSFCCLFGELDKVRFEDQCKKCVHKSCQIKREIKKNVPGDFHGLNAKFLFSAKPDWPHLKEGELYTAEQLDILKKYRDPAKIIGLALVYGLSAYSLAQNLGCSEQEAEDIKSHFFSNVPIARQAMLFIEAEVFRLGKIKNMFGRIRDVSRWAFSQAETYKQKSKDRGFALRLGLNHPIQSTAAEALKLSMLRADVLIQQNKWNPLCGLHIPQNCSDFTYHDFICAMLLSIHDEEDFLIRESAFDAVIPPMYKILQIPDIIQSLGVDFSLELDVEYDNTRSFTATQKYPSSKIFLLNEIDTLIQKIRPNSILIQFEDLTPDLLDKLKAYGGDAGEGLKVCVQRVNHLFVFPQGISEKYIKSLGIKYKKAKIKEG